MMRYAGIGAMLMAMLLLGGTPAASSDSGEALYEAAIHTMATLPIPPYIAYRLDGQSEPPRPLYTRQREDGDKQVWLVFSRGESRNTWLVLHRSKDFSNAIVDDTRTSYYTRRSFFDISWDGAYHALHDGILFDTVQREPKSIHAPATPEPENCALSTIASVSVSGAYSVHEVGATPHPVASAPGPCRGVADVPLDPRLRTIAFIHVMASAAYMIRDGGTVTCKNGDPGRMLHFTPRSDPGGHQLTDAIVDVRLSRFCMMRFKEPLSGATLEQHYAEIGGYWLQSDGTVSYDFPMPLPGAGYGPPDPTFPMLPLWDDTYRAAFTWTYEIKGIAFPTKVPNNYFAPQSGANGVDK